ncbi:MAG: DUF4139 domain-containing protein [Candidatus Zixiibacteriota bacterium]
MRKLASVVLAVVCVTAGYAQASVQITIYNQNLALVKDTRSLDYQQGRFELSFRDVAAAIDPTSVAFNVVDQPDAVTLLEQNYRYDLVSSDKVLEKYLDKTVTVITRQDKLHEGTLLASDQDALTLQMADGGIRIINREQIADLSLAELPDGLITRPTLVWLLDSDLSGSHPTEVRYLTSGIGWHAEYVATLSPDETDLELAGWVSVDNRSGATYDEAQIKLIAGDVHRATEKALPMPRVAMERMSAGADVGFEERQFFEYHLYTLNRPSTIRDREIKQLALFDPATVATKKVFTYDGARNSTKVVVSMEFKNSEDAGLGIPLPKGKVRVMKADTDGSLEFIGEDNIDHTPKDEDVRVELGNAFDIVGERVQKDRRQVTQRTVEEDYAISLRNHKDEAVTVVVVEHIWGDWTILSSSHTHRQKDATTSEWDIDIPADGETTLTFTVRRRY